MAKQKEKEILPANAFDEIDLGWIAPEYLRYERGWPWFALLFLINGLLVAYGFFTDSYTMMAVFAILPFVLLLEHRKPPRLVEVIFSPYGLKFGNVKIPYSHIRAFWILHTPPNIDEIHIRTTRKTHSEIVIPMMGINPAFVRQYLVTQIAEWEGRELPLFDTLVRLLRLN